MKKLLASFTLLLALGTVAHAQDAHFGKKISDKNALTTAQLTEKMKTTDTLNTRVTGQVKDVCRVKGCWMKVQLPEGQLMRVSFKDYGFFVPTDIVGKTIVMEGKAFTRVTPVDELKHYAEDAGKTKAEIAKITRPERALTFVADGVIVK